jgi:[acyl-carrier-protein] S-malonyltransferase
MSEDAPGTGSSVAYLFPGQGVQQGGMGRELYEGSAAARAVFETVEGALALPLTSLIFESSTKVLTRTEMAQPAVFTVSMACLAALQERLGPQQMPTPSYMAGHSLGEYTALAAAGVLDLPEAARLVHRRGKLMQEASERHPGGMAAVFGLDELTLEEICLETGAQISTINAEDQIVLAGERLALARALDLASIRGAKRIVALQVSGAFHTSLMSPSVAGMAEALSQAHFQDPRVPVISNCTGAPLTAASAIRKDLLDQMLNCVQWKRSMTYLLRTGVSSFYEIGPGRVLSGLVKRLSPQAQVVSIGDLASVQGLAS